MVRKHQILGENVSVLELNEPKCVVILHTSQVAHQAAAYTPWVERGTVRVKCLAKNTVHIVPGQRLVSQKPRNVFGPAKPFLNPLYLKTEKCIRLKLLV